MTILQIFQGDDFLEEVILSRAVMGLGRHPQNDIVLDDKSLSRFHARVERRGDRFVVVDCGSQNGVYVNDERIEGESALASGDRIRLGRYDVVFDPITDAAGRARARDRSVSSGDLSRSQPSTPSLSAPVPSHHGGTAQGGASAEEDAVTLARGARNFETLPLEEVTPSPVLVLLLHGEEVSRHPLESELTIGRSKQADVVIGLLGLSRKHARVTRAQDVAIVEDLGSQNGTWLNSERIDGPTPLKHGDMLNFYDYTVLFLAETATSMRTAPVEIANSQEGSRSPLMTGVPNDVDDESSLRDPPERRTDRSIRLRGDSAQRSPGAALDDLGEGSFLADAFEDDDNASPASSDGLRGEEFGDDPLDDGGLDEEAIDKELAMLDEIQRAIDARDPERVGSSTSVTNDFSPNRALADASLMPVASSSDLGGGFVEGTDEISALANSDRTAVRGPVGRGWPEEKDLDRVLARSGGAVLATLEVTLASKPYTQMSLTQVVTRVGTDARCELSLPTASGIDVWHMTFIVMGGSVVAHRAARDARIVHADVDADMIVLQDGDLIDLGKVHIKVRMR